MPNGAVYAAVSVEVCCTLEATCGRAGRDLGQLCTSGDKADEAAKGYATVVGDISRGKHLVDSWLIVIITIVSVGHDDVMPCPP